jgi:hypothetical protein
MHPMFINNVALVEGAFLQIWTYLVFPKSVQNLLNVLQVLHPILAKDEDVIQIHYHKIIGERMQGIIQHPHESYWGICQAKGYD